MKKNLFAKNPIISCYPEYGIMFSMMREDINPWIINNFTQIELVPKWDDLLTFDNHDQLLSQCPWISYSLIPNYIIRYRYNDIIDFVIEAIDEEKGVFVFIDRFYIRKLSEYQKFHFIHRVFINGYDMDNDELYISDNFSRGRFESLTCSFDDFKCAYYREESKFLNDEILVNEYKGDIIKYAIDIINSKKSAYIYVDRFFIKKLDNPFHMVHEIEFTGYDMDNREFYLSWNNNKYECGFDEFKNAYHKDSRSEFINDIGLISRKQNSEIINIDKNRIISGLENYYYSKDSFNNIENEYTYIFGVNTIEYIINNLINNKECKLRSFQLLYEHKVIMEIRVKFLLENGFLETKDINIEKFIKLKNIFLQLRNRAIKYVLTNKKDNLDYLIEFFKNALYYDKECCYDLINVLKKSSI